MAHNKKCQNARTLPSKCKCSCGGAMHGWGEDFTSLVERVKRNYPPCTPVRIALPASESIAKDRVRTVEVIERQIFIVLRGLRGYFPVEDICKEVFPEEKDKIIPPPQALGLDSLEEWEWEEDETAFCMCGSIAEMQCKYCGAYICYKHAEMGDGICQECLGLTLEELDSKFPLQKISLDKEVDR